MPVRNPKTPNANKRMLIVQSFEVSDCFEYFVNRSMNGGNTWNEQTVAHLKSLTRANAVPANAPIKDINKAKWGMSSASKPGGEA